jgi:hypothetical protein
MFSPISMGCEHGNYAVRVIDSAEYDPTDVTAPKAFWQYCI